MANSTIVRPTPAATNSTTLRDPPPPPAPPIPDTRQGSDHISWPESCHVTHPVGRRRTTRPPVVDRPGDILPTNTQIFRLFTNIAAIESRRCVVIVVDGQVENQFGADLTRFHADEGPPARPAAIIDVDVEATSANVVAAVDRRVVSVDAGRSQRP